MKIKRITRSIIVLIIISTVATLVSDEHISTVLGSGGTVTINEPSNGAEFDYSSSYTIKWTVQASSGYEIVQVQTKENGVTVRTDYPAPRNQTELTWMCEEWSESNPGLGAVTINVKATFTKNALFYYETTEIYCHSTGIIYNETFANLNAWSLSTYDATGNEVSLESYFDSGCTDGYGWITEDSGYLNTFALLIDTGVDLSDWSKYNGITIKYRYKSTSDVSYSWVTNTYVGIWGSSGDPLDYYYRYWENEDTTDTGWVTITNTLDNADFSTLTGLTIAFGFKDTSNTNYNVKVRLDYLEIYYDP